MSRSTEIARADQPPDYHDQAPSIPGKSSYERLGSHRNTTSVRTTAQRPKPKIKNYSQPAFGALEILDDEADHGDSGPDFDSDDDLLRPGEWLASIKTIEKEALDHSYFWKLYRMSHSDFTINLNYSLPKHTFIPGSVFDSNGLPSVCSVRCLSTIWSELRSVGKSAHSHLSSVKSASSIVFETRRELSVSQHILRYVSQPAKNLYDILSPNDTYLPVLPGLESLVLSRQILVTACHNIELLQDADVCINKINIIACDRPRVVKIVPIELSKIVKLITLLNMTIRCLLWGWLEGFRLPHHEGPCLTSEKRPSTLFDPVTYIKLQQHGSMRDLECFWSVVARAIDFGVVSFAGSHLTPTISNRVNLNKQQSFPISVNDNHSRYSDYFDGFEYTPITLQCLDGFLLNRNIWVLQNCHFRITGSAYVSTSIEDLSDVWGPITKLDKLMSNTDERAGCYYALGNGAIGSVQGCDKANVQVLSTETLCHYVSSVSRMEAELDLIDENKSTSLLIGNLVPGGLSLVNSCPTRQPESLSGIPLRPRGTIESRKYKASMTYTINAGYSNTSIGIARQYKYRDGITQKQRILAKWLKSPGSTHPDSLLMWHGLEISACTRNARRQQLWDIMRSEAVTEAFEHSLFEWEDPRCKRAFEEALRDNDPKSFSKLYLSRKGWRKELGQAISWILELLSGTGVGADGNLHVFAFVEDSLDPERLGTLSAKQHSWIPFIKDGLSSATFAIISPSCLASSSLDPESGQQCRAKICIAPAYSVLETAIVPDPSSKLLDSTWTSLIPVGKCISLSSATRNMLRVTKHLSSSQLLVEWTDSEYLKALTVRLSADDQYVRFSERNESSAYANQTSATVFVMSKNKNNLLDSFGTTSTQDHPEAIIEGGRTKSSTTTSLLTYPPEKVPVVEHAVRPGDFYLASDSSGRD